jgi:putative aldouronate transport system substrate-binding protein
MSMQLSRRSLLKWMAAAAASGALAACAPPAPPSASSGQSETAALPSQAPTAISMVEMHWGVPQDRAVLGRVAEHLSKMAQGDGVNIEFSSILLDDRPTQYPVLYASGEKFTFAFDAPWLLMPSLIDQDYLLPLEELIPVHAPKIANVDGDALLQANQIKGHLYGIVAWYYFNQTSGIILREDLRVKYGVPEISDSYESLEPFLKAIKENEPDMIPFAVNPNGQIGFGQGDDNFNSFDAPWYNPGNRMRGCAIADLWAAPVYDDLETLDVFQRYTELSYRWWQEGYLGVPPQATAYGEALNNGLVAAINENEPDFKYVQYQAAMTTEGVELKGYDMSGQRSGRVQKNRRNRQWNFIVFNKQAPEAEVIAGLEFFNWIYSDQANVDAWLFGQEGVDHNFLPDMRYERVEGNSSPYRRNWFVGGVPGTLERLPANTPQDAVDTLTFLSTPVNFLENPIEGFDPDVKVVEAQHAAYEAVYPEARYPIVAGTLTPDEALGNWQKMLDSAGRQELKAVFQQQLDDWRKANG